jgi:NADH-quinone oxidoreductase subunit N
LLYGIALTYGATGNTSFSDIARFLGYVPAQPRPIIPSHHGTTLLLIAMGLLAVGFAFKVSAIPFQAWTPDVYDGAPAPVTAFMSVGTKAAALIAFARVFDFVLYPVTPDWMPTVWAITVLTIVGGNILALLQSNVKRLLAYSSIAHAGYLLIGIVAGGIIGVSAILFYLLCYAFMNLGAFGIVSLLERADNSGNDARDIRGLWYRQPVLAGLLAFFMLALAGFPPMSGFAGKYYIFYAALQGGHPELLIIGVLASVLGMYYYLRVIATMFMEKEVVPAITQGTVSPAPALTSTASRRAPARTGATGTGGLPSTGTATAVAVKTPTGGLPKTSGALEKTLGDVQVSELNWISWTSIWIAAAGTLVMGTVLPFWLVSLAQQSAQMMLR